MMIVAVITRWMLTLQSDSFVAIDDGGLALIELDAEGRKTGAYLEIGGIPLDGEDDEEVG